MLSCAVCTSTVNLVKRLAKSSIGRAVAIRLVINVCSKYKLASSESCKEIIEAHKEHFLYVAQMTPLTGQQICQRLDYCDTPEELDIFHESTNVAIEESAKVRPLKIAHLADVHLDPDYVVGSEAECGDVICCHEQKKNGNVTRSAGPYGDYNCDTPERTIHSILDRLPSDIDMLVFTGDMPAHDVWNGNRGKTMITEGRLAKVLLQNASLPVFMSVGNHETVPANSFPYGNSTGRYGDSKWLYSSLAMQWLNGFSKEAKRTFIKHGWYSEQHKDFTIISLNTNLAYLFNVWRLMYFPDPDPDNQLKWLNSELERAGRVVILGHHPPGDKDTSKQWTRQLIKILSKYKSKIALMLFGHTHLDSFRLFRGAAGLTPSIITPSIATWTNTDPCYRIFALNPDSNTFNHTTFHLSLSTNKWDEEYKSEMHCNQSMYECYLQYTEEIKANASSRQQFIARYFKSSPDRIAKCDEECQLDIINGLVL